MLQSMLFVFKCTDNYAFGKQVSPRSENKNLNPVCSSL